MLKFLYIARIFNSCTFLASLSANFKHVILYHINDVLDLKYMVGNNEMSSFHPNLNLRKTSLVAPNMS
jgi:hypothetical protein